VDDFLTDLKKDRNFRDKSLGLWRNIFWIPIFVLISWMENMI
jgi:hypothetical protein